MAGYIIREREETLVLPVGQVDQLLQTADGETLKTTRCDENFPDDFWYSKPASSDYIKKSGGGGEGRRRART